VNIQGHNSRTKIQFILDVTLCFWVCSFQNLDLDPEDEGSTILRNVGNCSPNDTESHFRRLESSAAPQMSHIDSLGAMFILPQQILLMQYGTTANGVVTAAPQVPKVNTAADGWPCTLCVL
jgi:hypothetical protein